jgi:RNA polymerase sigma factor (sigma-70 family)
VARTRYRTALRQIHRLFNIGTIGGLTDGELLERFTSCDHDHEAAELAFATLVERHGPMVLRVCKSVLRDGHDAEDAFQASFLILVRKAASIRKQSSVASWLYGVAFRVACCQKGAAARRRRHEQRAAEESVESADDTDRDELAAVLHEELDRLPEKYRAPLVLCNFESLSHEQAARELCWPVGTVRSRLARGREQLRSRLLRRGLAPSVVFLKRALCAQATRAAIPTELATATVRAALPYGLSKSLAAGVISTSIASLVEGAMNMMILAKIKSALLACGLIATGAFVVAQQVGAPMPERKATQDASAIVPDHRSAPSGTLDDDDAVARELGQLDLDLLADEVQELRKQVEAAIRDKLRAERTKTDDTRAAQRAFEAAREAYLAKARELHAARRRIFKINVAEPSDFGPEQSAGKSTPAHHRAVRGASAHRPEPPRPAADIGSINLDAVFSQYEKVKVSNKELAVVQLSRKNELARIASEAEQEAELMGNFAPGGENYKRHENKVTQLKAQHEAGRELAERDFALKQASSNAMLYKEVEAMVARVAAFRKLKHIVDVSNQPIAGSDPSSVKTAISNTTVPTDRRNDITSDVIYNLNRAYQLSGSAPATSKPMSRSSGAGLGGEAQPPRN